MKNKKSEIIDLSKKKEATTRKDKVIEICSRTIRDKVLEYLQDEDNRNKALHIHTPYGSGKTTTVAEMFFREIITDTELLGLSVVWLSSNHKLIEDEIVSRFNVFHLKGRNQVDENGNFLCQHSLREQLGKYNTAIRKAVCRRCEFREGCRYREQIREILSGKIMRWCGVHQYLPTGIVGEYLERRNGVLILDENFVSSLVHQISITREDLNNHIRILGEIKKKNPDLGNGCDELHRTLSVLVDILEESKFGERDSKLIERIQDVFNRKDIKLDEILLRKEGIAEGYKEILIERLQEGHHPFKDILEPCFELLEVMKTGCSGITPFSLHCLKKKDGKERRHYSYSSPLGVLPNVPIIILDGSTSTDYYQSILKRDGREVEGFNMDLLKDGIRPSLEVYQVTDGTYPKTSFYYDETRKKLYKFVEMLTKHHSDERIDIVTHKPFSIERYAEKDTEGKTIGNYLKEQGVKTVDGETDEDGKVKIWHFSGKIRGTNKMIDDDVIIILGCPEPNAEELIDEISPFYLEEIEIDRTRLTKKWITKRIKDLTRTEKPFFKKKYTGQKLIAFQGRETPISIIVEEETNEESKSYESRSWKIYKDERLRVAQINSREHEITQIAHRHRPYLTEKMKRVYIISNLDLTSYEANYLRPLLFYRYPMEDIKREGIPSEKEKKHQRTIQGIEGKIISFLKEHGEIMKSEIVEESKNIPGRKEYKKEALKNLYSKGIVGKRREGRKTFCFLLNPPKPY